MKRIFTASLLCMPPADAEVRAQATGEKKTSNIKADIDTLRTDQSGLKWSSKDGNDGTLILQMKFQRYVRR